MASSRDHASRITSGLTALELDQLASEPFRALNELGFELRFRAEPEIVGDCSVAGSFEVGPPPVINVVVAASVGRQHFTALHEYGHRLVLNDAEIQDVFFEDRDGGRRLEEDICDAIAGQLLIPDSRVDEYIDSKGPTAHAVLNLIHATPNSSREACCVRAVERLRGPGHVMLARDGIAQFTASRGTPYRVRRATAQGDEHITAKAAQRGTCREEAPVIFASGRPSDRFFADAAADDDGYVVAVFVDAKPPWISGLALASRDRTDPAEAYCTHCEVDFTTLAAPCPKCRDYFHTPGCGRCSCGPAVSDRLCTQCFLRRPLSNFTGDSEVCDVCLGN